jgi:hypothetical protein
MKSVALASMLVLLIVAGTAATIFVFFSESGPRSSTDADLALRVAQLGEQLASLDARLAASESLEARIARLERRGSGRSELGAARAGTRADPGAGASVPVASEESGEALSDESIASALGLREKNEAELRQYIASVIQDERRDRSERARAESRQRRAELEELSKGPYGRHNFKVNSLAKKLGFSDAQKEHYHRLLVDYSSRLDELRRDVAWKDPESIQRYHTAREEIADEFDGQLALGLDRDQQEAYSALPEHEKGPDSGDVFFHASTMTSEDGSVAVEEVISGVIGDLQLPHPGVEPFIFEGAAPEIIVGEPESGENDESPPPKGDRGDGSEKVSRKITVVR